MATGSDFAWPSVTVKRSSTVLKGRSIVKCNWSDNFATLPEFAQDSFYSWKSYVTLKDNVIQPSSALCHAAEQYKILSIDYPDSHVFLLVSDGGTDHRLTYCSIQVSLLSVFVHLNLGMLVAVRTCPYQSWKNIAEGVILTLNLRLLNVPGFVQQSNTQGVRKHSRQKELSHKNLGNNQKNTSSRGSAFRFHGPTNCTLKSKVYGHENQRGLFEVERTPVKWRDFSYFEKIHDIDPNISANWLRRGIWSIT